MCEHELGFVGIKSTTYCFDVDGTICTNTNGDYEKAEPHKDVIEKVNELYEKNVKIIFSTARGFTTGKDLEELTKKQLKEWGVKYDRLYMDKPQADVYVDDKALNIKQFRITDE